MKTSVLLAILAALSAAPLRTTAQKITTDGNVYLLGHPVIVSWADMPLQLFGNRLGIFYEGASDRDPLIANSVSGKSGSTRLRMVVPGTFEFRMFRDSGFDLLAVSGKITILNTAVIPGETVNYRPDNPRVGIAVIGDSLSVGFGGVEQIVSWPSRLSLHLGGVPERNVSRPGITTSEVLSEGKVAAALEKTPQIVVVFLGGNDALGNVLKIRKPPASEAIPLETTFANLKSIVDAIVKGGAVPVIVGIRGPSATTDSYEVPFKDLAKGTKAALVPNPMVGVIGENDLTISDLIHPDQNGHRVLFQRIALVVSELYVAREGVPCFIEMSESSPQMIRIEWDGTSDETYKIVESTTLNGGDWKTVGFVPGKEGKLSYRLPINTLGNRFYRIEKIPTP